MMSIDDTRKNEAQRIIHSVASASKSISSALMTLSADTAVLTALHVGMIQALAKVFGIGLEDRVALGILHKVSGPLLGAQVARTLMGWLPGVGNMLNPSITGGYTEALGWAVYRYFKDGNFSSSDLSKRKIVFICYSHMDSKHIQRLLVHLRPVQELLKVFVDTSLAPGVEWRKEIETALAEARVAVLFISPDFAASDFIQRYEVPSLIDSAKEELAIIFPVLVSPVVKTGVVATLLEYQSPATELRPLIDMTKPQREKVFVQIAEAIIDATTS